MSYFQLITNSYHDPEDSWSGEDTSTSWDVSGVELCSRNAYDVFTSQDDFNIGDTYYAVYAIWSTGDSFSWNAGSSCELFGVYKTREQAEKRVKELENDESHSVPWNGYFERLDEISIVSGVLSE